MKIAKIRQIFLSFFKKKLHEIVDSSSIVVKNDPTLLFTNAGMNQFKEYFLGISKAKYKRVANVQKCLRVSGKHNDLEEVGHDTYHLTMFEMLGNWSFGQYFKKEAIAWAWEFLTEILNFSKEDLYVTVFEGDDELGVSRDTESISYWKSWVSEDKILDGDKNENFWEMGDKGPCGPCSEIHVDLRSLNDKRKIPGKKLVNSNHPLVIEIWNLVFIQFNRLESGELVPLPQNHVDTGMGLERLAMALQKKQSIYEIDIFQAIIKNIEHVSQKSYGKSHSTDVAFRVIADHIRAVAFSIADGQLPSNTGAGYVIKRILRRAIRYGFTYLEMKEPFLFSLIDELSQEMGSHYNELHTHLELISRVILEEERIFLRTIDSGMKRLDKIIHKPGFKILRGKKIFELYDTYGFPPDLTNLIVKEQGGKTDLVGFYKEMERQKSKSKKAAYSNIGEWQIINKNSQDNLFVGYDSFNCSCEVVKYRKIKDGNKVFYHLVLNKTPFYPEGGGQVGDTGIISCDSDKIYIKETRKEHGEIIHVTNSLPKELQKKWKAKVNSEIRKNIEKNHTATHLLHQALREVLGVHVEQRGSLVKSESLRFDFSHFQRVSSNELKEIQIFVNNRIQERLPLVEKRDVTKKEAMAEGALALFGEKYGNYVRTIRFGNSIELCGGTHVRNTEKLWYFKILSESSVASGIRRIEAISGNSAKNYFEKSMEEYERIKTIIPAKDSVFESFQKLLEENRNIKNSLLKIKEKEINHFINQVSNQFEELLDAQCLIRSTEFDSKAIKHIAFQLGKNKENAIILLAGINQGKPHLAVFISKNLVTKYSLHAGSIIKEMAKHIQGGGGGQSFFASAGGKILKGIDSALDEGRKIIVNSLG